VSVPSGTATETQKQSTQRARVLRWALIIGACAMVAIGLVLLLLLTQATNNRELYERNYGWLFGVNAAVAVVLLLVISWVAIRLWSRLRRGQFGSRLLVKLAAIFALVGFTPGLLIYVVSYQFVSRSIESWFDVKVEGALAAGLNLATTTIDTMSLDLGSKARAAAAQMTEVSDTSAGLSLERLREELGAVDVVLWSGSGQLIASAGESRFQLNPDRPTPQQLRQVRSQRVVTQIDGLDDAASTAVSTARIKALALVASNGFGLSAEPRFLQITRGLSPTLVANANAVTEANREYQERALARGGLRRMYISTLTLSLFLAVFGAVLLAVVLGNQLARPLLVLAEGVREVAHGDLSPKLALQGKDELGGLTRSFADMTQQLADARTAVDQSMVQVNAAHAHLQTILDNMTAGVIVLDANGVIQSSNPGATRILRAPLAAFHGRALEQVDGLQQFAQNVQAQFEAFQSERTQHGLDHWQQSFELHASGAGTQQDVISLVARGAEMPTNKRLLVFDDVSEIVSNQRAQAWGEVARRLAHEIKNPLTPIQLSAERLEMKLTGKVDAPDQALLSKSVKTIVDQVAAMKRLVNEFRDFGRLPSAELKPLDLNTLVREVLQLYGHENARVPVQVELDPRCPSIMADSLQLRQVVHNLLQNAQDAMESNSALPAKEGEQQAGVVVRTHWSESSHRVRLAVLDKGPGFAENILKRAFEPYVTTKPKGTGLGLAVVKKIADEHSARIDLSNRVLDGVVQGAQVSLSFPVHSAARV
jgi:nitrogen fixation/metabolism regulation signal transduction histidine kinase